MRFKQNMEGAMGFNVLFVLIIIFIIVILYMSGIISIASINRDEFEDYVYRDPSIQGMMVPIKIQLTFNQDLDSTDQASIRAYIKHIQIKGEDNNYVPDAEPVDAIVYNKLIFIKNDNETIYSVNGVPFRSSKTSYNSTIKDLNGAQWGPAHRNYKVWYESGQGQRHIPNLNENNHVILIQMTWQHYKKASQILLSSDTVNFAVYYKMPDYNEEDSFTKELTYYCYVPFNDFSLIEDIRCEIKGYSSHGIVEWETVTDPIRIKWSWGVIDKFFTSNADIELIKQQDSIDSTALQYHWDQLNLIKIDNEQKYGSHSYLYKVR